MGKWSELTIKVEIADSHDGQTWSDIIASLRTILLESTTRATIETKEEING